MWSSHLTRAIITFGRNIPTSRTTPTDRALPWRFWPALRCSAPRNSASGFSVRCSLCTSIFVYLLGRKLFREKVAFWSVVGLNFLPVFNVESILMTVDSLSIFFWSAALYIFWLSIERSPRFSIFWPLTGILVGMGFLCKYENAFQLLSILLFLFVVPKYRNELGRPNLYLLFLCFLLFLVPLILWNLQHEWIGLEHLSNQALLNARSPSGLAP